ncbi:MAG: 4-hydroxy-tetrahydrodipicolinate synthase [Candidatus Firestonebacteria bacterium RIFOXYC2_FULL_39_67]|nr:MAG: 4-hydroxy-tetrahydrodipicolinate synthase [Candidatus Firestonebacteria bacterium RIFOXYD2_FULL_39_29]OGF53959.1 MAG: 4-hydroxy-tetrahydrodipicolinate synthase [Candidatus Firestonebacteria bacterium RIFOXYC2_FULL_39_67]
MFEGLVTALITPFKNYKVDEARVKENVEFQIKNKVSGLLPCGTTGESPTLSNEEHKKVIQLVLKAAKGRVPVMAGTGSNSTDEAVELTRYAKKIGCDAALMVSPYYNKPTQKGLYMHFKKVADTVDIPIMLYNIPGRTGVTIETATMLKLKNDCKNIIGVKEATGSLDMTSQIISACGKDFCVMSGDDNLTLPIMSVGGKGVISVISNIMPGKVAEMTAAYARKEIKKAIELHYFLFPLIKAAFIETNPIPIKTAMMLAGMDTGEMRLPMCEMEDGTFEKLKEVLKGYGLVK